MAKTRTERPIIVNIPPVDDKTANATPDPRADRERKPPAAAELVERLAIPIDDRGKLSPKMRESTRERLRALIADPDTAKTLGLAADTVTTTIPIELAYAVVGSINQVSTLLVASITKAPGAVLREVMPFSPEEREALAGPVQLVLSKYSGPLLTKYAAEIGLGLTFVTILQGKIALVRAATAARPSAPAPDAPGQSVGPVESL
jgi:hypothetical protein